MSLSAYEARHGGKPGSEPGCDAAAFRDLAYRSRRIARAARRSAETGAGKANPDVEEMLLNLSDHAEAAADSADALASWLEHGAADPAADAPAGGTDA